MCTCIWNLETMPVNNDDAHLQTQNLGGKLVIFEALFKSLLCFQCSWNLQGMFIDNWSRDCQIYKKHYRAVFWKMWNLLAWTKFREKTVTKTAECKLLKFFLLAIARSNSPLFFVRSFQWNQTTMRWSRVSQAYHFLKNLANCVDSMLFHCFYDA